MVSALQQLIGQLIEFSLPGWIIGPPFQQVLPWSSAGRGEVIAGSLDQQRLVSAALLQHLQEPRALVQLVALKAHQQVLGVSGTPLNQLQGHLGG